MKTTRLTLAIFSLLGTGALVSCSDNKKSPDAPPNPDTKVFLDGGPDTPDAGPTCTPTVLGTQDISGTPSMGVIVWNAPVTTDLGDGGPSTLNFEFYSGIETSLMGTFDLTAGNQNNYATCAACLRLFTTDAMGAVKRQFYQDGGSITLTQDPFTNKVLMGTATGVSLIEVTIDPMSTPPFTSTPVVGGQCLSLGAITLDADAIPNAWTCPAAAFSDGNNCDCGCGAHDPDCDLMPAKPVVGCMTGQICSADVCVSTCDVLSSPPVGCTTGVCGYRTATQDVCYADPAIVDPALVGAACGTGTALCAVVNTVATGVCDLTINGDDVCRKACNGNSDCTATQVCATFLGTKGMCVPKVANDTCPTAGLIVIGTPVTGTTGGAAPNYNLGLETATCTGFPQPGPDVTYKVVLTAGQAITATLSGIPASYDPSLALLGPGTPTVCSASPVTCLVGADTGLAGAGETFQFTATTAGIYYILVDSFSLNSSGDFTLTVTSP